jgi:IPT/TIG domain
LNHFTKTVFLALIMCLLAGCEEEFQIKDVSPAIGVLGGGESVEIRGSGFDPNMGVSVYFGTSKARKVVVGSTKKLIVSTPSSGEAKAVDIRIATDDGKEYLLKEAFRYVEKSAMDIRDLGKRKSMRKTE